MAIRPPSPARSGTASNFGVGVMIVALLAPPAAAQVVRAEHVHRFHLLTPALASRLRPATKDAVRSVAMLRSATGFVVYDPGDGKGLLLTNEHVTRSGVTSGEAVHFYDGTVGTTRRLLTSNAALDYGLIEIDLPEGPRRGLSLEVAGLTPGRAIYALSAYANLSFSDMQTAVGGGKREHQAILSGATNRFAITSGVVDKDSTAPIWVQAGSQRVLGVLSRMPNSAGMSGSPVLASDTHKVVGLHSSGNGRPGPWEETSVPVGNILQDLDAHLHGGSFDPVASTLVDGFLKLQKGPSEAAP